MSTIVKHKQLNDGNNSVLLKGAPERVIEKCKTFKTADGKVHDFDKASKQQLIEQVQTIAGKGLRCLATAIIYDGGALKNVTQAN